MARRPGMAAGVCRRNSFQWLHMLPQLLGATAESVCCSTRAPSFALLPTEQNWTQISFPRGTVKTGAPDTFTGFQLRPAAAKMGTERFCSADRKINFRRSCRTERLTEKKPGRAGPLPLSQSSQLVVAATWRSTRLSRVKFQTSFAAA